MTRFIDDPMFMSACASNVAALAQAMPTWPEIAGSTAEIYVAAHAA